MRARNGVSITRRTPTSSSRRALSLPVSQTDGLTIQGEARRLVALPLENVEIVQVVDRGVDI